MRTFEIARGKVLFQGVVFTDGAVSVRRITSDPCGRYSFSFDGISECESELGIRVPDASPDHDLKLAPGKDGEIEPLLLTHAPTDFFRLYRPEDNGPEPEDVG